MELQPNAQPAVLDVDDLSHAYGAHVVVSGISFSLARGAIACLLGASGCGKTTVLRCIAGLESRHGGSIRVDGRQVAGRGAWVPPERRGIGMVFQDHALFPHLRVRDNIGFGLHAASRPERARRIDEMAALVGLADSLDRYPHEISGGQQQRVALARALAPRPALLLLDEPFSSLDVDLRERLAFEVRGIIKASGATAIVVTHDQQEAFAMADEVGIVHDGRLAQWAPPRDLYHRPASRHVAGFIGQGAFLPAQAVDPRKVESELGIVPLAAPVEAGAAVELLLRPEHVVVDEGSPMRARIVSTVFRGADVLHTLQLDSGRRLLGVASSRQPHREGERIGIRLDIEAAIAFPATEPCRVAD